MLDVFPFAVKRALALVQIIFVRRMVCGLLWVRFADGTSFDTDYILFAAWLNILAVAESKGVTGGINGILMDHYKKYGRTFFSR